MEQVKLTVQNVILQIVFYKDLLVYAGMDISKIFMENVNVNITFMLYLY